MEPNSFPYGDGDLMTYCLFAPAEQLTPEKFHLYRTRALAQAKAVEEALLPFLER